MIIRQAEDPYKKHWWAILAGFGLVGVWLCLPLMETSVGSTRIDVAKPVAGGAEQNLDASAAPAAESADAVNLSMGGTYSKKKADEAVSSSLYQSPEAPKAAVAALGGSSGSASSSASSSSLAQSLKAVGDKKDSSWGGEKPQRGFSSPRLSGGSLSGLGSSSGGSSASAGSGMGAFGSRSAQVGYDSTRGLRGDAGAEGAKPGSIAALRQAEKGAVNAASLASGDGAASGMSKTFDGAKGHNAIAPGGKAGADAGLYSSMDAAPVNLKLKEPTVANKELKPPPTVEVPKEKDAQTDLSKQMAMMVVAAVVGGMIPGVGGQVATAMMSVAMK